MMEGPPACIHGMNYNAKAMLLLYGSNTGRVHRQFKLVSGLGVGCDNLDRVLEKSATQPAGS